MSRLLMHNTRSYKLGSIASLRDVEKQNYERVEAMLKAKLKYQSDNQAITDSTTVVSCLRFIQIARA